MKSEARGRLLDAMLVELAEKGYRDIDLVEVLARCVVSPAEYASEFSGIDECLFSAYERLTERLIATAIEYCEPALEWPERVRLGLEALLGELADEPELARVLTRVFPSIRPDAYARYMGFLEAFVPFFSEGRGLSNVASELPGEVEMLAVGSAEAIIVEEIEAGRVERLPTMTPAILFSLLVPFVGPQEASAAMQSSSGERP